MEPNYADELEGYMVVHLKCGGRLKVRSSSIGFGDGCIMMSLQDVPSFIIPSANVSYIFQEGCEPEEIKVN